MQMAKNRVKGNFTFLLEDHILDSFIKISCMEKVNCITLLESSHTMEFSNMTSFMTLENYIMKIQNTYTLLILEILTNFRSQKNNSQFIDNII
jgi:hypothetical protein